MPDWTADPKLAPPPGKLDPPAAEEVKPVDAGWSDWIREQIETAQSQPGAPRWQPGWQVAVQVHKAEARDFLIGGAEPSAWKKTRTAETVPPEPYSDYTRWSRTYPEVRYQTYRRYEVRIFLGDYRFMWQLPPEVDRSYTFWQAEGPPVIRKDRVEHRWWETSRLLTDEMGRVLKVLDVIDNVFPPDPYPLGGFGPKETPGRLLGPEPLNWQPVPEGWGKAELLPPEAPAPAPSGRAPARQAPLAWADLAGLMGQPSPPPEVA